MTKIEHSPLPWRKHQVEPLTIVSVDKNGHGAEVANCLNSMWFDRRQADTELIVRAVNSHAALIEALEYVMELAEVDDENDQAIMDQALAALAQAKGE